MSREKVQTSVQTLHYQRDREAEQAGRWLRQGLACVDFLLLMLDVLPVWDPLAVQIEMICREAHLDMERTELLDWHARFVAVLKRACRRVC